MDCRIEYNGKKYTDDEFRIYLADRGITEDQLSREKELIDRAVKLSGDVRGIYKEIFNSDPRTALQEAAQQANQSSSERKGAIKAFGREIVDIAQRLNYVLMLSLLVVR